MKKTITAAALVLLYLFTSVQVTHAESAKIPVLMYHAVSDEIWGERELFVSPDALENQIQYLLSAGYTPVTPEDAPRLETIEKPILLTFDDGYRDNYVNAYPILKKYGVKATFFIITDTLEHPLYMNAEMLREISDSGLVSVQSHTTHHLQLNRISDAELDAELRDSARMLEEVTGIEPVAVCYPFGAYSEKVKQAAARYYDWGFCIEGKCWRRDGDTMNVTRLQVKRSTTLDEFKKLLQR